MALASFGKQNGVFRRQLAVKAYADSIESDNPVMAADLRKALINPEQFPAQHF